MVWWISAFAAAISVCSTSLAQHAHRNHPLSISSRTWNSDTSIVTNPLRPTWREQNAGDNQHTLPRFDSELRAALRTNDLDRMAWLVRLGRKQEAFLQPHKSEVHQEGTNTYTSSVSIAGIDYSGDRTITPKASIIPNSQHSGQDVRVADAHNGNPGPSWNETGISLMKARSNGTKMCCKCSGVNPDLRWRGAGSPIIDDMHRSEYVWGQRGDEEPKNPVSRKNQPRPECCPCGTSSHHNRNRVNSTTHGSDMRFANVESAQGAVRAALNGMSPWVEVLALVVAQKDVQRLLVRGDAIDAQEALRKKVQSESPLGSMGYRATTAAAALAAYHEQLEKALLVVRVREMLAQRAIDRFQKTAAVAPSIEALTASESPSHPQFSWHTGTASAMQAAARTLCDYLGRELCEKDVLSLASNSEVLPMEVTTAFRLLSRGPASSICVAVGAVRCTRSLQVCASFCLRSSCRILKMCLVLQEAMAVNDTATTYALRSLLLHAADAADISGRLRIARERAWHARNVYAEAVEQVGQAMAFTFCSFEESASMVPCILMKI